MLGPYLEVDISKFVYPRVESSLGRLLKLLDGLANIKVFVWETLVATGLISSGKVFVWEIFWEDTIN